MAQHIAVYGNVHIVRGRCPKCKRTAFIIDEEFQCCGRPARVSPRGIKRVCEPEDRRHRPNVKDQQRILEQQNYRCCYCDVSLVGYATYHGSLRRVRLTWDHVMPYAYSQNNREDNFVATCQFCNSWKASFIFKTIDEVRIYVAAKWEEERAFETKVRRVRKRLPTKEVLAEVLPPTVSVSSVEPTASAQQCKFCTAAIKPWLDFCDERCKQSFKRYCIK